MSIKELLKNPLSKENIEQRSQITPPDNDPIPNLWYLTGPLDFEKIKKENFTNAVKSKICDENSELMKKQYRIGIKIGKIGSIITLILCLVAFFFINPVFVMFLAFFLLIFSWSLYGRFSMFYGESLKDIKNYKVAKMNNWFYNPTRNLNRGRILQTYMPTLFPKGNFNETYLENEFWGKIPHEREDIYFHKGEYIYTTINPNRKNNSKQENKYLFMNIKNPKPLKYNLTIKFKIKFLRVNQGEKEIKFESNKFNTRFSVLDNSNIQNSKMIITKAISPAIQDKLLDYVNRTNSFIDIRITPKITSIMYGMDARAEYEIKTSFKNGGEITPEMLDKISKSHTEIVDIILGITQYLD